MDSIPYFATSLKLSKYIYVTRNRNNYKPKDELIISKKKMKKMKNIEKSLNNSYIFYSIYN